MLIVMSLVTPQNRRFVAICYDLIWLALICATLSLNYFPLLRGVWDCSTNSIVEQLHKKLKFIEHLTTSTFFSWS